MQQDATNDTGKHGLHRPATASLGLGGQAMQRPPIPPFTHETAAAKVRAAQDAWNTRDPKAVVQAYTPTSKWRNRGDFFQGHEAIEDFLTRKCNGK